MAVIEHKLAKQGASGSGSGDSPTSFTLTYSATYLVKTDDLSDGPKIVHDYFNNTAGLPKYGTPYSFGNDFDATAVCRKIDPKRVAGSNLYVVEVSFEPIEGGGGSEPQGVSIDLKKKPPLQWHDEIEISYTQISMPVYKATFHGAHSGSPNGPPVSNPWFPAGKVGPVINSAHTVYDPPPEAERDLQILRISRNVFPYDDITAEGFRGTVNKDDVMINKPKYGFKKFIPKHRGKIKQISANFQVDLEYKVKYYHSTIEVHIHPLSWRDFIVDRGLYRRARSGDKTNTGETLSSSSIPAEHLPPYVAIVDASGKEVTVPVLLNGNGAPLKAGEKEVYLEYQYYDEVDWSFIPW